MDLSREQLAALARQVAATAPDELDCEAILDRVAAYLEATRAGRPLPEELRQVGQHLSMCPACFEEFQALLRAAADDQAH